MLSLSHIFLFLLVNISVVEVVGVDKFSRDDFPPDFVFGSGTSAYQVCLLINGFIQSFQFFFLNITLLLLLLLFEVFICLFCYFITKSFKELMISNR